MVLDGIALCDHSYFKWNEKKKKKKIQGQLFFIILK